MRQAIIPLILAALTGCMTTGTDEPYAKANTVMAAEISRRIQDIQFQHRTELLDNLMWLTQSGEQAIPYLVPALRHDDAKVRANAAWVLGRIKDRRVITDLQQVASDQNPTVRLEVARSLVALGDLKHASALIEGLDSDRPAVRYNCHQALKEATNRDFGYDHLSENAVERQRAVLRWRQWWGEQFNDRWFAQSYAQAHGFGAGEEQMPAVPPAPMTEPAPMPEPSREQVAPGAGRDQSPRAHGSGEQGSGERGTGEQGAAAKGSREQSQAQATTKPSAGEEQRQPVPPPGGARGDGN